MSSDKKSQKGVPKPRSPAYPGIDLEEAINRARQLHSNEHEHAAPLLSIVNHWGYSSNNGPARVTAAALKYFGLMDYQGTGEDRKGKLTSLALDILLDDRPQSNDRENAIKICALKPAIHSEIWSKYNGNLPSDQSLRYMLRREKGFTERGANEFLSQFRSTLEYAKLTSSDDMPSEQEDESIEHSKRETRSQAVPETIDYSGSAPPPGKTHSHIAGVKPVEIPLPLQPWPVLTAKFPMTEEAWESMLKMLEYMKPALVSDKNGNIDGNTKDDENLS